MTDLEHVRLPFAVEINRDNVGSTFLSFSGELDFSTAENMRQVFLLPDVTTASAVVVDLAQVTFFDSTAIGILVAACKRMRSAHKAFSVACGKGIGRRELEISGLLEYLQVGNSS